MAGMQLATIESRPVSSEITANGSVSFNENRYAQIRPRVDGILRHIHLDVGAIVHAGDELAIVDSATLGEYKASFVYAVVNVKYTETYCERLRRLAEQQAIPSKTLFEMEHMLQEQQLDVARAPEISEPGLHAGADRQVRGRKRHACGTNDHGPLEWRAGTAACRGGGGRIGERAGVCHCRSEYDVGAAQRL